MNTQSLLIVAKHGVRKVERGFTRPDDDWAPVLLARSAAGMHATALAGRSCDDDAAAITGFLRNVGATEAALVHSAWSRTEPLTVSPLTGKPAHPQPERREVVVLAYVTAENTMLQMAQVRRSANATPTLGEFEATGDGINVGGGYIDALRLGVG